MKGIINIKEKKENNNIYFNMIYLLMNFHIYLIYENN